MIKRIWRRLLSFLYEKEKVIVNDLIKRERFKRFVCLLPIQTNKVVMDNFHGRGYGENPKYIAEELLRRKRKCKIIWLSNDPNKDFPEGVTPIWRNSLRSYFECATAKAWVFNTRNGKLTKKRKGQIYLQTWHGEIAIKKVECDAADKLSESYLRDAKEDGLLADGIIVDGKPNEELFRNSFWLGPQCNLLKTGSPRIDILLQERDNQRLKQHVRECLGLSCDSFFVLYAPTFRENHSDDFFISDLQGVYDAFERRFGHTEMAIRLHPNAGVNHDSALFSGERNLCDATYYPDPQELIIAADCLITDYSSLAYEFSVIRKPVFLLTKDINTYIQGRGVYDLFYHQPFRLNYSDEDLIEDIEEFSYQNMTQRVDEFYRQNPSYNTGNASAQVVDWLYKKGLK